MNHHMIFFALLYSLFQFLLAGAFAVEAMRQVAESLLRRHRSAVLVDVLQLHFRLVPFLLAEFHRAAGYVPFPLTTVLVVGFSAPRQNSLYIYSIQSCLQCSDNVSWATGRASGL